MKSPVLKPPAKIVLTLKTNEWRTMDDVQRACAGKPVKISGKTLDLRQCQIVGSKLPRPRNEDSEESEPLRINIPGFTLRNGSIRGIPGGIVFREPNHTYENLDFLDIGEDAISNIMDDAPDASIIGCQFYGASDKSVQMNDARGLTFIHNQIHGGITGVRLQKKLTKYKGIETRKVSDNSFYGVDTAWSISGGVSVIAQGTRYAGVKTKWVKNSGATYKDLP